MNLQKRKSDKFDETYVQYRNLVMKVSYDIVKDYYIAQEICQQTFLDYYLKMENVEDRLIKAWLMMVAKNASIDHVRKASSRYECSGIYTDTDYEIVYEDGVEKVINTMVQKDLIFKIMDGLKMANVRWYDVIVGVSILNKPQEEVAGDLGISLQILRARLYRARGWIRSNFGEEYDQFRY